MFIVCYHLLRYIIYDMIYAIASTSIHEVFNLTSYRQFPTTPAMTSIYMQYFHISPSKRCLWQLRNMIGLWMVTVVRDCIQFYRFCEVSHGIMWARAAKSIVWNCIVSGRFFSGWWFPLTLLDRYLQRKLIFYTDIRKYQETFLCLGQTCRVFQ